MKLSERLMNLETDLAQILADFQELKQQVNKLEQENHRLRAQLSPHVRDIQPQQIGKTVDTDTPTPIANDGHHRLVTLYEEGYHVCHLNFGQEREGECLFCLGFLSNANT